jgi:hypothetical protein
VEAAADMSRTLAQSGVPDAGDKGRPAKSKLNTRQGRRCLLHGLRDVSSKVRLTDCSSDTLHGSCSTILPMLSIKHTMTLSSRV